MPRTTNAVGRKTVGIMFLGNFMTTKVEATTEITAITRQKGIPSRSAHLVARPIGCNGSPKINTVRVRYESAANQSFTINLSA